MKRYFKIFILIVFVALVLGIVFGIIDGLRVHNDEDPLFTFYHKVIDGIDYSAKVDAGLGYKIIRYSYQNQPEIVKIGSIFMSEKMSYVIEENNENLSELADNNIEESGENSGENVKITTFGEKYTENININGIDTEIYAQNIISKLGYSMDYYFELFDYTGFDDHDKYVWNQVSGDNKCSMTIYDVTDEKAHKELLENINKEGLFEEISGDGIQEVHKTYKRVFKEDEIEKVNFVYLIWLNDLNLMVDLYMPLEYEESVGIYMKKMAETIK